MIEKKLLRLERMSSAEKVRHWVQEKPWEIDGKGLKLPSVRAHPPSAFGLDDRGNIIRAPFFIGRPCFGQVTAFLRHGGGQYVWSPRQKSWQPSRCTRCPLSKACEFVAEQRLEATVELKAAYREWRYLGGRNQTWLPDGSWGPAAVRLPDILRELQRLAFKSIRDHDVQDHYERVVQAKLVQDRERKRRDRERHEVAKARAGEITPAVEQVLEGHQRWRAVEHRKASSNLKAPPWLRRLPPDASMFDANVWLAYVRVWLRGHTPNPYSCAKELHVLGIAKDRSVNALRDRVGRSIERMHRLQRLRLDGAPGPVWPPFTLSDLREGVRLIDPTN
jgi:hypothetical protein